MPASHAFMRKAWAKLTSSLLEITFSRAHRTVVHLRSAKLEWPTLFPSWAGIVSKISGELSLSLLALWDLFSFCLQHDHEQSVYSETGTAIFWHRCEHVWRVYRCQIVGLQRYDKMQYLPALQCNMVDYFNFILSVCRKIPGSVLLSPRFVSRYIRDDLLRIWQTSVQTNLSLSSNANRIISCCCEKYSSWCINFNKLLFKKSTCDLLDFPKK